MSFLNDTFGSANLTGSAASQEGQSAGQFVASFGTALGLFGAQVLIFLLIKDRFARIYQPRTYLVPEKERVSPPPPGWFLWVKSVLTTSNSDFVQKCGLDAYFFLRYLRTLLKIFVPAAFVILPILLPLNAVGGRGSDWALTHDQPNVTGLDQLSWSNVRPADHNRLWAHWILALLLVIWVGYIAFDELKNYIRMRQAYMTSPQHRLRASATTVLVCSIPAKWNTVEALDGLYDVFPGGVRNIWINRNFDELADKVKRRDKLAKKLEGAETALIRKCFEKHEEKITKEEKEAGKKLSKEERKRKSTILDEKGREQAEGNGLSSGDPHQVKHSLQEALGEDDDERSSTDREDDETKPDPEKKGVAIPVIGNGINAVAGSIGKIGQGLFGGIRGANRGLNGMMDTTNGFVASSNAPLQYSDTHPDESATLPGKELAAAGPENNTSPLSQTSFDRNSDGTRVPAHSVDNDQRPLTTTNTAGSKSTTTGKQVKDNDDKEQSGLKRVKTLVGLGDGPKELVEYPQAFDEEFRGDTSDAIWRRYVEEKDRKTHRLPIFGWHWMFSIPLIGKKVDTIYYCREEVARLNAEIEDDQEHPERFPVMNSAFIQFNHQVAAHMACQCLSNHIPQQMSPRLVEIDPNDVIWDNLSIPWWQIYLRTTAVLVIIIGMIILWAIPVAFTSALSHLSEISKFVSWLSWVNTLPYEVISIIQGILPPALLGLLMFLLPLILQFLSQFQGEQSGVLVELSVQKYYFAFLFVQLFLVVTIGGSIAQVIPIFKSVDGFTQVPNLLGITIPQVTNYFFSYMILQALSVSSGALLQVGSLVGWFLLAPILDKTARAKFNRQTNLQNIQWGTFFPVYTNLACIGLIYSVISPLILVFNIITFSLFWFAYRYNTLYVTKFTRDTGGLLYPNAINFTFVGVYVAEIALIGMFFLVRYNDTAVCKGQAIGMIVILILTAIYQILLNMAFSPLFKYLPITLEDDAVRRDEEFALAMHSHRGHERLIENERDDEDIEDQLEDNERRSLAEDQQATGYEMQQVPSGKKARSPQDIATNTNQHDAPYEFQNPEINMDLDKESKGLQLTRKVAKKTVQAVNLSVPTKSQSSKRKSWADRDNAHNRRSSNFGMPYSPNHREHHDSSRGPSVDQTRKDNQYRGGAADPRRALEVINNFNPIAGDQKDIEAQRRARAELGDALFAGVNDELEDLTPEQRDALVQRAFQHAALRARRPVIWLPRDELGVSDDEVKRMAAFSPHYLWVSNVRQGLDSKGRCVYSGAPPDFSEIDVIQL